MSKKPKILLGSPLVYSTNPDFKLNEEVESDNIIQPSEQTLYLKLERLKGNKIATIVENFKGKESDLADLAKVLKNKCGTGGSYKDGFIIIQGEKRQQVNDILISLGYKTKMKGG